MAWVYILQGASGRHYIGSTTDLDRRLEEHRRGHTHTTKRLGGGLEVAAALEFPNLAEARALERELKRKKNPQLAHHPLNGPSRRDIASHSASSNPLTCVNAFSPHPLYVSP